MFFKRISDVYDEEYTKALNESGGDLEYAKFAENHRFQIDPGSHWNDVRQVTNNVGFSIQNAMQAIEKANPKVLIGIFGDAAWTNKDRLSDQILTDLIEHFSQHVLSIENVPDDKLGDAYEFLIKKFADDSGHTAAEFYTNRTVVHLMSLLMKPQPGESVYDPTCGSGGMLLNCALQLKDQGKEYRSLKLYGQEINLITSSIARMNMFLHGIEDFNIARGDTLTNPAFLEKDTLKKFNVILANPPYSIKRWNRSMFEHDPYGRNMFGTPPQGCADYAFQQHIIKSLEIKNGRCAILWPHGVLFRDSEKAMRQKMIEAGLVETVIALGKNLFYNSSMESCILICKTNIEKKRQNKVLMINAYDDVIHDSESSYLTQSHINKIINCYKNFEEIEGFSKIVEINEIIENNFSLLVTHYVMSSRMIPTSEPQNTSLLIESWINSSNKTKEELNYLLK